MRRPDQQVYVPRPKRASFGGTSNPSPPVAQLNNKSSIQQQQITDGSYCNSLHEDSSFSEDNNSLSSCEMSVNPVLVTNLHINGTQTGLLDCDDDTMQSSCKHLKSCSVLNSSLGGSRCSNDDSSGKSVIGLEESEVSITQLNRYHDFRNDKSDDCEYLNSSSNTSYSFSNSRFNESRGQQNCSFDGSAEEIEVITSLHSKAQDDGNSELQKKEQTEVIGIQGETLPILDFKEPVKQNVENEICGNCQPVTVDCSSSSDNETDRDAVQSEDTSINISLTQTSENIDAVNNSCTSGKQKTNIEIIEKSSQEDRNLKNRRILHSFPPVSDVLIISDTVKNEFVIKNEISDKKSIEITANSEAKSNSELGNNKVNSLSDESKNKNDSKSAEMGVKPTSATVNRDECDWETMFTDDGECLVPGLIEEVRY